MNQSTRADLENLHSQNAETRYQALIGILKATEKPVDWAYEVWDELVDSLRNEDNHERAIAAQLLCNLAKSDPENRMRKDFDAIMSVTKDKKFVTARHCLQTIWKVAAPKKMRRTVLDRLAGRFRDCDAEKNCTLIRYDIIQGLKRLYDEVKDEKVRALALELIEIEEDSKYRTKYAGLWPAG
jgi:hypothetical protein